MTPRRVRLVVPALLALATAMTACAGQSDVPTPTKAAPTPVATPSPTSGLAATTLTSSWPTYDVGVTRFATPAVAYGGRLVLVPTVTGMVAVS